MAARPPEEQMKAARAKPSYKIFEGKLTYDLPQLYQCECPIGHGQFGYKTRLPLEDIQKHCVHCGTRVMVSQGGTNG